MQHHNKLCIDQYYILLPASQLNQPSVCVSICRLRLSVKVHHVVCDAGSSLLNDPRLEILKISMIFNLPAIK